jgi:short subunit dehydrogenase-like uncharacterized protein
VHACGFDSIPSDLGVWFTQQRALERFGVACSEVRMAVAGMKGGLSGGTAASGMNMFAEMAADPELRATVADPYVLAPPGARSGPRQPAVTWPTYGEQFESWLAPFVMAPTNSAVVLRSHALLGHRWGDDFTYGESLMAGDGLAGRAKALAISGAMAGFAGAASFGPARAVMGKVIPEPGEGPSPAKQQAGWFELRFAGRTAHGDTIMTRVTGDQDPGYGSTSKMVGEAAVALVELDESHTAHGFLTPATAFGDTLVDRLVEHAGLVFEVM